MNPPSTRDEICPELRRVALEGEAYWNGFPTPQFLAPLGPAWSPADNVRHLLKSAGRARSEADLEACRLPHPLLGKLTVREMLLFTLDHEVHHVANVARRLAGSGPAD